MASWFYTDGEATRQGPVDDQTLLQMNREGSIDARTLVWREGRDDWSAFSAVAPGLFGEGENGVPASVGVCAHSGRVYPVEEMIPYGEALVGREHKDAFAQQLMETATVAVSDATERRLAYVGFWWRCLSSLLDYLVKMVPYWICMVPYYVAAAMAASSGGAGAGSQFGTSFTTAMALTYGIGMLGMLGVSISYETWMVGRFQGTLGKLIIGAKVVNPDGSGLSYGRAFVRWLAKKPLATIILWIPPMVGLVLVSALVPALNNANPGEETVVVAMLTGMFLFGALFALSSGIYWMAAFDSEKRTLHDRVASTRVVNR